MEGLVGWKKEKDENGKDCIRKEYVFHDFNECFGYMARVALESEKVDHHPNWKNCYNKLTIEWSTHTVGGLSEKDYQMAAFCDKIK